MTTSQTEADVQAAIMLSVGARRDVRLFRNNTGSAWQGEATKLPPGRQVVYVEKPGGVLLNHSRLVHFGLHKGSPDLVGWRSVTIKPEHVGQTLAVFVGLEVKTATGRPSEDQRNFLNVMSRCGALGGVARSDAEAEGLINKP